jgi:iron complex transport system permease protein
MLAQLPGAKSLLPLNSVTALIGAPVVVWVIMKRRQVMEAGV